MEKANVSEVDRVLHTGECKSPEGIEFYPCGSASSSYWTALSFTCPEPFLLSYKVRVLIQNSISSFQALKFCNFIMD